MGRQVFRIHRIPIELDSAGQFELYGYSVYVVNMTFLMTFLIGWLSAPRPRNLATDGPGDGAAMRRTSTRLPTHTFRR